MSVLVMCRNRWRYPSVGLSQKKPLPDGQSVRYLVRTGVRQITTGGTPPGLAIIPPLMSLLNPTIHGAGHPVPGLRSTAITTAGVVVMHVAILALLLVITPAERLAELVQPLTVRLIELAPEPQLTPKPPIERPKLPQPRLVAIANPAPAMDTPRFTVPAVPAAEPLAAAVPPAPTFSRETAVPLVLPRFDAAYLNNPKPVYPNASRRLGEDGRVVLRVHVNAGGVGEEIEIRQSSGFPRLDAAARDAVTQWRFVPARRGEEAVAAWVLVPIVFSLEG
jgi:protein TonB